MDHPNLRAFIEQFEREATRLGSYRSKLGEVEMLFLRQVWGPGFQFNFGGLRAEYPFRDFKGGQRFIDFVYILHGIKLLIEIDGFTTHARNISPAEFDDHLARQNDLVLAGWIVLRFSANQVERTPQVCQRQIKQAIGHWWSLTHGRLTAKEADHWSLRRNCLIDLANRHSGRLTPIQVADEFEISRTSAVQWIRRFVDEGLFTAQDQVKRVRSYTLVQSLDETQQ